MRIDLLGFSLDDALLELQPNIVNCLQRSLLNDYA
jgi:hypothetical protein